MSSSSAAPGRCRFVGVRSTSRLPWPVAGGPLPVAVPVVPLPVVRRAAARVGQSVAVDLAVVRERELVHPDIAATGSMYSGSEPAEEVASSPSSGPASPRRQRCSQRAAARSWSCRRRRRRWPRWPGGSSGPLRPRLARPGNPGCSAGRPGARGSRSPRRVAGARGRRSGTSGPFACRKRSAGELGPVEVAARDGDAADAPAHRRRRGPPGCRFSSTTSARTPAIGRRWRAPRRRRGRPRPRWPPRSSRSARSC